MALRRVICMATDNDMVPDVAVLTQEGIAFRGQGRYPIMPVSQGLTALDIFHKCLDITNNRRIFRLDSQFSR